MSEKAAIVIGAVLLLGTFLGHFYSPEMERLESEEPLPNTLPRRDSGNAHDRRLARRKALRGPKLAADQTPARGARGRWRNTFAGESNALSKEMEVAIDA